MARTRSRGRILHLAQSCQAKSDGEEKGKSLKTKEIASRAKKDRAKSEKGVLG